MKQHKPRLNKLIRPRLQLWLVSSFVGLAGLGMLLQFLVLGARLTSHTSSLAGLSGKVVDAVPGALLETLAFTMVVLLPIIFVVGILITLRVAGPLHRFETYLAAVVRGDETGPCRIREGDRLQVLCGLINDATESLRRSGAPELVSDIEATVEPTAERDVEPLRLAE